MTQKRMAVVTGGAGFIGSHMVDRLLAEGFRVHAIDNLSSGREENLSHHKGNPDLVLDIRDVRQVTSNDSLFRGAEFVFHFAGVGEIVPSIEEPEAYLSANVMGTVHVLEAARHAGSCRFVNAASSSCYGLATELPTTEKADISPQYPYALSKYLAELSVFHWGQVYHLPVISIRIFNAFGPRSRTSGAYGAVFGVFLKQKLAGKPFTVVGDGTQTRDFLFVTDVVQAFCLAAFSDRKNEVYNLGAGSPQSVNLLVDLLGGGEVIHLPKRPAEPDCTFADISRIQSHLGWSPSVPFDDGVKRMLENIEYWRNAPLWEPASIQAATEAWFKAFSFGKA